VTADTFYRVRIGDYRIGLELAGDELIFVRCLHRKEIYRYFP
jgi:mRNA interferase RelE/StbE